MDLMCKVFSPSMMNRVKEYCGHGIGREMHMLPYILHFANGYSGKMVKSERMI